MAVKTSEFYEDYLKRLEKRNLQNRFTGRYGGISRKIQKGFTEVGRKSEAAFKKAGLSPQAIAAAETGRTGELLKSSSELYADLAEKDISRDMAFGEKKDELQLKIDIAKSQEEEQEEAKKKAMWGTVAKVAGVGASFIPGLSAIAPALGEVASGVIQEDPTEILGGALNIAKGISATSQLKEDKEFAQMFSNELLPTLLSIKDENKRKMILDQARINQTMMSKAEFGNWWDTISAEYMPQENVQNVIPQEPQREQYPAYPSNQYPI